MKILFPLLFLLLGIQTHFSQESETEAVKHTIESFFKGFHEQDSTRIKQTVSEGIILQTIAKNNDGGMFVKTEDFSGFLRGIAGIPDSISFREDIKGYTIKIDGAMANAWTAYEFWLNDTFSHCGINSFQLFNDGRSWKIIYLIDTRRKEDCP